MILYHGTNCSIDKIDLNKCRPYKDFGKGFYLTMTLYPKTVWCMSNRNWISLLHLKSG